MTSHLSNYLLWPLVGFLSLASGSALQAQEVIWLSPMEEPVQCAEAAEDVPGAIDFDTPPRLLSRGRIAEALNEIGGAVDRGTVDERAEVNLRAWILLDTLGKAVRLAIDRAGTSGQLGVDTLLVGVLPALAFEPARLEGRPVCHWMQVPFRIPLGGGNDAHP